jgi:hypothetical protein
MHMCGDIGYEDWLNCTRSDQDQLQQCIDLLTISTRLGSGVGGVYFGDLGWVDFGGGE